MQVTPNQNTNKLNNTTPCNIPTGGNSGTATNPVQQGYNPQYCYCPYYYANQQAQPQPQPQQAQMQGGQNVQVPATSAGVNIQIFNPSVGAPGGPAPTYNVNAPCYPSGYYTGTLGPDGKMHPNGGDGNGNGGGGRTGGVDGTGGTGGTGRTDGTGGTDGAGGTNTNGGNGGNGGNIDTTNNTNNNTNNVNNNGKKTEKRKIVQLTDEYIKYLEKMLNSQDSNVRRNAAQDVYDRLEEDDSRCDDKALTALVNKMLQDPEETVRVFALSALESRLALGDEYTANVLKKMEQSPEAYGQDAIAANRILLKMSGQQVEKEFEVKEKPKDSDTNDTKTSRKE